MTNYEELAKLAEAATPGPRLFSPRDIRQENAIRAGAKWQDVAANADPEEFLGWECESGLPTPERGDFTGPDSAFLAATDPAAILALLSERTQLAERVASLEAQNTALLKDRDEATATFQWLLGEREFFPLRTEGDGPYWWRSELRCRLANPSAYTAPQPVEAAKGGEPVAWKSLADKAIEVLNRHIVPDGISDKDALSELYGIFDGPEYRAALATPPAPTVAPSEVRASERFADLLRCQREQAETKAGDPYMVGLYNGMAMMCANFDNATEWECLPAAQAAAAAVVSLNGEQWEPGNDDDADGDVLATAGIHITSGDHPHGNAVEFYGETLAIAKGRRNAVLGAMRRAAADAGGLPPLAVPMEPLAYITKRGAVYGGHGNPENGDRPLFLSSIAFALPEMQSEDGYTTDHNKGYSIGWNACREKVAEINLSPRPAAVMAVAQDAQVAIHGDVTVPGKIIDSTDAMAGDRWRGSLAQVVLDVPLPERNDKYQSGFVDAKAAILEALRAAGFDRQPAMGAGDRDAILESAVQAVAERAGDADRMQVIAAFDAIRSLKANRFALPESIQRMRPTASGAAVLSQPVAEFTTGHCEFKKQKGGCPHHNVHCGYPACDRRPVTTGEKGGAA